MTKVNAELIVNSAYIHISNINKCLKNSKSDTFVDFIQFNANGIITTNKPASDLDLSTIKKYLKNVKNINPDSFEGCRAFLTIDSTFLLEGRGATNMFAVGRGLTPLEGRG